VEDDPEVRSLTRATLERHGYRVLEAPDGLATLGLWRQHRDAVALLLTDLVMPGGLSGRDLARRLRLDRPQLKVIYTSGYSAELAGREWHPGPGEAFLQKPCPVELLLETVRQCLDAPLINCLIPLAIAFSHHAQKKSAIASRLGCSHPSPSSSFKSQILPPPLGKPRRNVPRDAKEEGSNPCAGRWGRRRASEAPAARAKLQTQTFRMTRHNAGNGPVYCACILSSATVVCAYR
jgi:CheY-like chemotaxis protein